MKNLKRFNELIEEGFFDSEGVSLFGSLLRKTLSNSVNTDKIENETELKGEEEPGGSPSDSPVGKGISLDSDAYLSSEDQDSYGSKIGISDKGEDADLEQPFSGPIGNISNSAYANLNVPTRGIPGTGRGNLGCAAAVSLIFYRATGYSLAGNTKICLGTKTIYDELDTRSRESGSPWKKISDWKNNYKPGDIIITSKGSRAGHVGVVVNDGNIISNSSRGIMGNSSGQIESNYTIKSWESIAKRNPSETCIFRYFGPYKTSWS
jgi:hypothetical protein